MRVSARAVNRRGYTRPDRQARATAGNARTNAQLNTGLASDDGWIQRVRKKAASVSARSPAIQTIDVYTRRTHGPAPRPARRAITKTARNTATVRSSRAGTMIPATNPGVVWTSANALCG